MQDVCKRLVGTLIKTTGQDDGCTLRKEVLEMQDCRERVRSSGSTDGSGSRAVVILRCTKVTLPIMAMDFRDQQNAALSASFIESCTQQRSVLHPDMRHVVILYGMDRVCTRVKVRLGRLSPINAVLVFILASSASLPRSIHSHFVFMNVTRHFQVKEKGTSTDDGVQTENTQMTTTNHQEAAFIQELLKPSRSSSVQQLIKTAVSLDPAVLLSELGAINADMASIAAHADLQLVVTKCWGIVSRYMTCSILSSEAHA